MATLSLAVRPSTKPDSTKRLTDGSDRFDFLEISAGAGRANSPKAGPASAIRPAAIVIHLYKQSVRKMGASLDRFGQCRRQ
jgi:hypothetical protein